MCAMTERVRKNERRRIVTVATGLYGMGVDAVSAVLARGTLPDSLTAAWLIYAMSSAFSWTRERERAVSASLPVAYLYLRRLTSAEQSSR